MESTIPTAMDTASLQPSLEEEEAPYLDMSITSVSSVSGLSPRSLIISQSQEVCGSSLLGVVRFERTS